MGEPKKEGRKVISTNRKAHHEYTLEGSIEAGIVLMGSEIKSIRDNRVNLRDGFVQEQGGELWLLNVHISPYDQAGIFVHDPMRPRKLLLHPQEITRVTAQMRERGYTVVPTMLYLKNWRAKVEIALAPAKTQHNNPADMANHDSPPNI